MDHRSSKIVLSIIFVSSFIAQDAFGLNNPQQPPVPEFKLESCQPYYSAEDYLAMSRVKEVPEVRRLFSSSYLFVPNDDEAHPGILWMHGSEGGRWSVTSMCKARYLAAHGYAAMFFCYSDCGDNNLPESINRIDLKRTYDAMIWLKSSRFVNGKKIALSGASRGAEQTLALAVILAKKKTNNSNIVLPDAVFVHAPYGQIVSSFNWRFYNPPMPREWRWNAVIDENLRCLEETENGPYTYKKLDGTVVKMSWKNNDTSCNNRPALGPLDCWIEDQSGPYQDSDTGRRYHWQEQLCGQPMREPDGTRIPAWTWDGGTELLTPWTDIELEQYNGPILISQGMLDEVWNVSDGAQYLQKRLAIYGRPFYEKILPQMTSLPSPIPQVPLQPILFYLFEGEQHRYMSVASKVEAELGLSFFRNVLD